ncbi:MAG: lysylphosphatidylglycerol synthase transmembrane domain-containing protein [Chitinispirillaceae bacterium]
MKISRILQFAGGLALAGAGLYVFFDSLDLSSLAKKISDTSPWVIVVCSFLSIFTLWLRAIRWRIILPPAEGTAHKKGLFRLVTIAYMVNNILPARLGEAARVLLLWRRNGYTVAASIGSLVLERVIDMMVFSSFFFLPVLFSPILRSVLDQNPNRKIVIFLAVGSLLMCVVALGGLFIYSLIPQKFRSIAHTLSTYLPSKVQRFGQKIGSELVSNLDWVFSKRKIVKVVLLSYATAFCYSFILYFLAGDSAVFGVLESMFGQAFAAFGAAIPLTPGFVGTLHAALLQGLIFIGIDPGKAGAMVILYHALSYLTVTVAGLFFFFSMNVTISDITRADDQIKKSSLEERADGVGEGQGSDGCTGVVRNAAGSEKGDRQEDRGSAGGDR